MPIKPEKRALYSEDWERISRSVRDRAGDMCEMCGVRNKQVNPRTDALVILTVHHINGDPTDNRRMNLIALCQEHHNRLDQPFRHQRKAKGELL